MYNKPDISKKQIKYAIDFVKGNINEDEYIKEAIVKNRRMYEMIEIVKDKHFFNQYISKVPYFVRPRALKEVHGLSNLMIRNMRDTEGFKGTIDNIMIGNFQINSIKAASFYDLAIILDVPYEYLSAEHPIMDRVNPNSFFEYVKVKNSKTLKAVLEDVIQRPKEERNIKGYILRNEYSTFNSPEYIRTDKRTQFFSLEFFVGSIAQIDDNAIENIINMLPEDRVHCVLLSKALLRDVWKVSFLGLYDNNDIHKEYLEKLLPELKERFDAKEIYPTSWVSDLYS
jgi:hypothetical protein